jgi:DNA polymerase-1
MDQELRSQYSLIKEYLRLMNIPYYSEEGYEADDLLASFVAKFHAQIPTYVATRDKDLFQVCMYPNAFVILVSKATNRVISAENVKQIMGITPQQIATFKALSGDTSDNIKGVRGIGPKTAVELINTFGTLPFIVDAALSGKIKKNTAALIVNNLEEMLDSHFLGSLQIRETDVPLEDFQRHPGDENKLNAFYKRLDLRSLLLK